LSKSKYIVLTLVVVANFPKSINSINAEFMPIGYVKLPKSNFISTVTGGAYSPYLGPIVPYAFFNIVELAVAIPKTPPVKYP
jgi:hypothetical protein